MRVLLYVEPHPIRNTFVHFNDVARRFLPLLVANNDLDIRMFSGAKTLEKVGVDKIAPYEDRIIRATSEEESVFEHYMFDWNQNGISLWEDLLRGRGEVTDSYISVLRRIWRSFPFDIIVHWGENGAITRFLEERPVTRIAMELGCTRIPFFDSIVLDPFGTNGASVTPKLSVADLREIVGGHAMSSHEAILAYSQNLETLPYEQQFSMLPAHLSSRLFNRAKLAFFPLQLYDDANLVRFSPYDTLVDVVLDVVPKLAERGYTVVIKPHPASKQRPSAAVANALAQAALQKWSDHVVWLEGQDQSYSNTQIIRISDLVVTVNSSVGFEALYFEKPVVVLGDAIYKPKDLFPTLDDIVDESFDIEEYKKNIGYLRRFFLGGYLQPENIRSNPVLFAERLSLIHGLQQDYPNDPLAFARNYWRSVSPGRQVLARAAMFAGRSKPGGGEFGLPKIPAEVKASLPMRPLDGEPELLPYFVAASRFLMASKVRSIGEFEKWLSDLLQSEDGVAQFIDIGELIDPEYYLAQHEDVVSAQMDPMEHFIVWGFAEGRAAHPAIPGISSEEVVKRVIRAVDFILNNHPVPEFPLDQEDESARQAQLGSIRSSLSKSPNKIAVVAHLYYLDLVPEVLNKLGSIPEKFDLIITLPGWGYRRILEMVESAYPDALIYKAADRGHATGPFMDLLPILAEGAYDAILKVETKRDYYVGGRLAAEFADIWREETFSALLGTPERVAEILTTFRTEPDTNMVGASAHFQSLNDNPYRDQGHFARLLLDDDTGGGYFAGSMFWAKPDCLRRIAESISIINFTAETGGGDGMLPHLVERLFGHAATTNGGRIHAASEDADEKLTLDAMPTSGSLHDHLVRSFQNRGTQGTGPKSALAW